MYRNQRRNWKKLLSISFFKEVQRKIFDQKQILKKIEDDLVRALQNIRDIEVGMLSNKREIHCIKRDLLENDFLNIIM